MIYQKFNSGDVVAGRTQTVSSGLFSDGNYSVRQTGFVTNPTQIAPFGDGAYAVQNGLYYWNVYYGTQVHFSLSYGSLSGNGSPDSDIRTSQIFPSKANYQSYMNLLLDPSQTAFSFVTGSYNVNSNSSVQFTTVTGSSIFAMGFDTNLFKNQVNPGQIQFALSGANGIFTFIDDSSVINRKSQVYNIISGSINPITGVPTPYTPNSNGVQYQALGLFYPKNGVIILNASVINNLVSLPSGTDSAGNLGVAYTDAYSDANNFAMFQSNLYNSLYGAGLLGESMYAIKSELIPTTQYYVRIQNANFNYTNNPTFISDGTDGLTKGTIKIPALRSNPTTYITTVGLYDSSNELVAVAKLSQPLPKSFDNEYVLKVNLAY